MLAAARFSQTQAMDPRIEQLLRQTPGDRYADVALEGPPTDLAVICAELDALQQLASQRPNRQAQFACEADLACLAFAGYTLGPKPGPDAKPMTAWLLTEAVRRLEPITYREKARFDRVRPSVARPSLGTALPLPNHASYPSGHAATATLMAEILAELSPQDGAAFREDARRIAHNREIAGLHYISDSEAGARLAGMVVDRFRAEAWYRDALPAARCEWGRC